MAARDIHEPVVTAAFELVDRLIKEHFALLVDALPELGI